MFSGRPSVRACMRPSVRDSRGSFMFPQYLQYLLTVFRQTFVTGASWDTDDLITFLGRKVKGQGHTIAAKMKSKKDCCVQIETYSWIHTRHLGLGLKPKIFGLGPGLELETYALLRDVKLFSMVVCRFSAEDNKPFYSGSCAQK